MEESSSKDSVQYTSARKDSTHLQQIIDKLSEEELERYKAFRRSAFNKSSIRKFVTNNLNQSCNANFIIGIAGVAKVFVGELVEEALQVKEERGSKGSLKISEIHEAFRRKQTDSFIDITKNLDNNNSRTTKATEGLEYTVFCYRKAHKGNKEPIGLCKQAFCAKEKHKITVITIKKLKRDLGNKMLLADVIYCLQSHINTKKDIVITKNLQVSFNIIENDKLAEYYELQLNTKINKLRNKSVDYYIANFLNKIIIEGFRYFINNYLQQIALVNIYKAYRAIDFAPLNAGEYAELNWEATMKQLVNELTKKQLSPEEFIRRIDQTPPHKHLISEITKSAPFLLKLSLQVNLSGAELENIVSIMVNNRISKVACAIFFIKRQNIIESCLKDEKSCAVRFYFTLINSITDFCNRILDFLRQEDFEGFKNTTIQVLKRNVLNTFKPACHNTPIRDVASYSSKEFLHHFTETTNELFLQTQIVLDETLMASNVDKICCIIKSANIDFSLDTNQFYYVNTKNIFDVSTFFAVMREYYTKRMYSPKGLPNQDGLIGELDIRVKKKSADEIAIYDFNEMNLINFIKSGDSNKKKERTDNPDLETIESVCNLQLKVLPDQETQVDIKVGSIATARGVLKKHILNKYRDSCESLKTVKITKVDTIQYLYIVFYRSVTNTEAIDIFYNMPHLDLLCQTEPNLDQKLIMCQFRCGKNINKRLLNKLETFIDILSVIEEPFDWSTSFDVRKGRFWYTELEKVFNIPLLTHGSVHLNKLLDDLDSRIITYGSSNPRIRFIYPVSILLFNFYTRASNKERWSDLMSTFLFTTKIKAAYLDNLLETFLEIDPNQNTDKLNTIDSAGSSQFKERILLYAAVCDNHNTMIIIVRPDIEDAELDKELLNTLDLYDEYSEYLKKKERTWDLELFKQEKDTPVDLPLMIFNVLLTLGFSTDSNLKAMLEQHKDGIVQLYLCQVKRATEKELACPESKNDSDLDQNTDIQSQECIREKGFLLKTLEEGSDFISAKQIEMRKTEKIRIAIISVKKPGIGDNELMENLSVFFTSMQFKTS